MNTYRKALVGVLAIALTLFLSLPAQLRRVPPMWLR